MWKIVAALAVAAGWAGEAQAQEQQIKIGPPAAWVQAAGAIKADAPDDGAAVRFLLMDSQLRFGAEGTTSYAETAIRVETPQGLQAMSTLSLPWDPALATFTMHKLQILRGSEVIDVLAKQKFTILRRESNLEAQELDGVLTAVLQPEDLRVGDVIDMAYSVTSRDPALAGHTQWVSAAPNITVDDLRLRATSDQHDFFWRAADGIDGFKSGVTSQGRSVSVAMKNVQPLLLPENAPSRFRWGRLLQYSDFRSWAEVSAVMAPLYAKASTVGPQSPLQAEIARIKAAAADPKARAEAALALVEDQVRYVALSMDDGGYVPADADLTWKRRFGDCKGKTTLLLALLHGLGIDAQPALVNASVGDGMDQRLPAAAAFDHVLVRATIGGKVYWLDGTRLGDRKLDDILTPAFDWALPVQSASATLMRLTPPPLDRPDAARSVRIDASAGIDIPAPTHAENLFRGDEAYALNATLSNLSPAQQDAALRKFWTQTFAALTATKVSAVYDPAAHEERFIADGVAKMDWQDGTTCCRLYEPDGYGLGWTADFDRLAGPHADAPFAAKYPVFEQTRETIVLPNKGAGFTLQGEEVDRKIGVWSFHRKLKIDKGIFTLEASTQSLASEFTPASADAATLKDMSKQTVYVVTPPNYVMTRQEVDQYRKKALTTAKDLMKRGDFMRQRGYLAQARTDMEAAIALDSKVAEEFAHVSEVYASQGDVAAAREAIKKGLALKPDDIQFDRMAGFAARLEPNDDEALAAFGRALAKDPKDRYARQQRVVVNQNLGRIDEALADIETLLKDNPKDQGAQAQKIGTLVQAGRIDKALAEADVAIATDPKASPPHMMKASILEFAHRQADAQAEYDAALALNKTAQGFIVRSATRPSQDYTAQLKDLDEALKLAPADLTALEARAATEARQGQFDKALADINAAVEQDPDNVGLRQVRAFVYTRAGKTDLAEAEVAWARGQIENTAGNWNSLCFNQAMWNLSLDKALADCEKAKALSPRSSAILDSRAFVLFRLGRIDEALRDYAQVLKLAPREANSLYGRGLAELQKGMASEGRADLEAARRLQPRIDDTFASYGVTPPAAYASSTAAAK